MTYYTTKHTPVNVMISANLPVAPKPKPTMSWAEMAKAEGHRKKHPASPPKENIMAGARKNARIDKVLSSMPLDGAWVTVKSIAEARNISTGNARSWILDAIGTGLVEWNSSTTRPRYRITKADAIELFEVMKASQKAAEVPPIAGQSILDLLYDRKPRYLSEMARALGDSQQTVSNRLMRLKAQGMVASEKKKAPNHGPKVFYYRLTAKGREAANA